MKTTKEEKMKDLLSKYTENLATQRAVAIDSFISKYIPSWQTRIIMRLPFVKRFFGYEIVQRHNFGEKIELRRYGKHIATLTIIEKVEEGKL